MGKGNDRVGGLLGCALALCGALLATTPAWAQSDADAAAREAFERGVAALQAGNYREAADAFDLAYRLRPLPIVQYNLGLADSHLGRNADAVAAFERYLAASATALDPNQRDAIRAEITRLSALTATLTLRVEPAGAHVLVDGRERDLADALVLDAGRHVIEADAPGYRTTRDEIVVAAGQNLAHEVTLARAIAPDAPIAPVVPAPAPVVAPVTNGSNASSAPATLLGSGVALAAVGLVGAGVLTLTADSLRSDYVARCVGYTSGTDASACSSLQSQRQGELGALEVATYTALGVGVVGLGVAAVGWYLGHTRAGGERVPAVSFNVAPGSVGASVRVQF